MKLYTILPPEHLILGLKSSDYIEAVKELLKVFNRDLDSNLYGICQKFILIKEEVRPTLLTDKVAVPHARVKGLRDSLVALGISYSGIETPDEEKSPLHFIVILLSPPTKNTFMLQMLSAISKLFKSEEVKNNLLQMKTPQRIINYIAEINIDVKKVLCVEDIMANEFPIVQIHSLISDVVEKIAESNLNSIPVVNESGVLVGEVSAMELMKTSLPNYLNLLSNKNFLTSFDPFENYFLQERKKKVSEIMNPDVLRVKAQTPVLEIAQLLMENKNRQIYICDNDKPTGVIDSMMFVRNCLQV